MHKHWDAAPKNKSQEAKRVQEKFLKIIYPQRERVSWKAGAVSQAASLGGTSWDFL